MRRAGPNSARDASVKEHEVSRNIVRLINNCFEEGQYESGMTILSQSCSISQYPIPAHMRQILYIALYPPASIVPSAKFGTPRSASPRKLTKRNRVITPEASREAVELLVWLSSVNPPSRLLKGLPAYGKTYRDGKWEIKTRSADGSGTMTTKIEIDDPPDEDDSLLCKHAHTLVAPKDVWSMLSVGFITGTDELGGGNLDAEAEMFALMKSRNPKETEEAPTGRKTSTRTRSSRKKHGVSDDDDGDYRDSRYAPDDDEESYDGDYETSKGAVAPHVWDVLDWLLLVFEKDEQITEQAGRVQYSPLLLAQIPPSAPRFNIERPLDVVFSSLLANPVFAPTIRSPNTTPPRHSHAEPIRYEVPARNARLGVRLLNLLINLTLPTDPHALEPAALIRLTSASITSAISTVAQDETRFTMESFDLLFQNLGSTKVLTSFKIALLCLYLATNSTSGDPAKFLGGIINQQNRNHMGEGRATSARRTKPPRKQQGGDAAAATVTATETQSSNESSEQVHRNPFPLPAPEDIVKLFLLQPKPVRNGETKKAKSRDSREADLVVDQLRLLCNASAKVHLLSCIMTVMTWDTDEEWCKSIRNHRLKETVAGGFGHHRLDEDAMDMDDSMEDAGKRLDDLKEAALSIVNVIATMGS